jgi:hypothetical protein
MLQNLIWSLLGAYLMYYFDVLHGFFGLGDQRSFMPDGLLLIGVFYAGYTVVDKLRAATKSASPAAQEERRSCDAG